MANVDGVSIVVTAYNVEKYLDRCLKSLIKQTYKNIEIIIVDDGSTDHTSVICDKWSKQDSRINVIHKENGGLSDARNTGIKSAKRDYICFVDGDDYIEKDLVELTYKRALEINADAIVFSNYDVSINGEKKKHPFSSLKNIYSGEEVMKTLFNECLGTMPTAKSDYSVGFAPWGRLCRRKTLIDNDVYFKSERILIYEDLMFLLDLLPVLNRVAILDIPLYDYCENEGSLTRKYDPTRFTRIKKQYFYLRDHQPYKDEIFGNTGTLLRFKRTMLGYIRNSVTRSLDTTPYSNIKKISNDSFTHEIINDYPINKLPIKQQVFAYSLKYQLNWFTLLVTKLNKKMKK